MKISKFMAFKRWCFRLCGGVHLTEHKERVWAAEVFAEKEAAELRLQNHLWQQRHAMLCRMLNEELVRRTAV